MYLYIATFQNIHKLLKKPAMKFFSQQLFLLQACSLVFFSKNYITDFVTHFLVLLLCVISFDYQKLILAFHLNCFMSF